MKILTTMPRHIYLKDEITQQQFGHPEAQFFDFYIKDQPLLVLRYDKHVLVYHVQDPSDLGGYFVVPELWVKPGPGGEPRRADEDNKQKSA